MGLFSWFRSDDSTTDMRLVTNSIDSGRIREVTENGDQIFVAEDVPFIRAQELAGGYVPEAHIRASADEWTVPLTVNHPRNSAGDIVSANTSDGRAITVGESEDPQLTEDEPGVAADLRINADRARELGGEGQALVESLEDGDGLEVSSQYFAEDLPAGEYDGEFYERVEGQLQPDSIALLPQSEGVCSLPECGIAPEGVTANATGNDGRLQINDQHLSVTAIEASDDVDDEGLIERGLAYLGAAVSDDKDIETATRGATSNCADCDCEASTSDERAESRSDATPTENQSTMVDIDRETIVSSVAKQVDLDASTLQELDDESIKIIYESAVKNADSSDDDGDDGGDSPDENPNASMNPEPTGNSHIDPDAIPDEVASGELTLDEYISERISANDEQTDKEQTVDEIVANSAEYDADDRDDLLDTPQSMLDRIQSGIDAGSPGLPGSTGATANASTPGTVDEVNVDEFSTGVISND